MSELEILNTIRSTKGISNRQLIGLFPEEPTIILDDHLEALIISGLVTLFKGSYYPISRSIGIIPKGQSETVQQIEIEELSLREIKKTFTPNEDDPLFFDSYFIDKAKSELFKEMNTIKFDFDKFDYYLLCQFDNF